MLLHVSGQDIINHIFANVSKIFLSLMLKYIEFLISQNIIRRGHMMVLKH